MLFAILFESSKNHGSAGLNIGLDFEPFIQLEGTPIEFFLFKIFDFHHANQNEFCPNLLASLRNDHLKNWIIVKLVDKFANRCLERLHELRNKVIILFTCATKFDHRLWTEVAHHFTLEKV